MLPHMCACASVISSHDLSIFEAVSLTSKKAAGKDSPSFIWTSLYPDKLGNSQGNWELLFLTHEVETETNLYTS